ncbi:hypothetical protein CEE39_06275 [bacterium (candidate division B38) B3_B38]|nr:MAG: hypothetical protein CEE39_06275 [bacterium (candidate division B38) B3_B38]
MSKEKRHCLLILTIPLLLVLLLPLMVANSGSPQAASQSRKPTALAPDGDLPFDPREVVEQSSSPGVIDPMVSNYTTIAAASDYQREPRVAYNSTNNTYLVVWEDKRNGTNYRIYGQRVRADGSLLGSNIPIWFGTKDARYPDVAYNSFSNNWLVVWQYDGESTGNWYILCRGVNIDGSLFPSLSAYVVAYDADSKQQYPRVAYNSTQHNFCVVWEDERDYATLGWEVYSRIVGSDAEPIGSINPVVGYTEDQWAPAIAYLPSVDGYLVAWVEEWNYPTTGYDIACKRVNKDGIPLSTSGQWVVNASDSQLNPEVAANTIDDNFMVVWQDARNKASTGYDIYGQRMSSANTPAQVGSGIVMCTFIYDQAYPTVCYSPTYNRYLVAWHDFRPSATMADIYGQLVKNDGTVEGPLNGFRLSSQYGVNEVYPHIAWNSSHRNFFLVQEDNRYFASSSYDIFGRKVTIESAILTGMGFGGKSWYKAFDIYGRRFQNIKAFGGANPNGEIDVKVADLNLDGNPEMVVAHGSGGKSWIKIFNYDGTLYNSFKCFGASNTGGQVHLAVGNFAVGTDLEIAVATGRNGTSQVKVFETYGTLRASFKAYGAANAEGEVYLAATDFDGDGKDEIITGTGIGGNSLVKIFSNTGTFQGSFYAFGSENTQGSIHLAAGNFDAITSDKEIAVATGQGGTNTVKIFEQNGTLIDSFVAFGSGGNPTGSVHLGAVEIGAFAGAIDEILCGQGYGGNSWVKLFYSYGSLIRSFKAFGGTNANGEVYVSGSRSH